MKNLDVVSKRILVSAISVCMILLCASLFLLSLNALPEAKATPIVTGANLPLVKSPQDRLTQVDIWPFGITGGKAYWIEYNSTGWLFRSSDVTLWKSAD